MILPDGRIECNICGWQGSAAELWEHLDRGIKQACPVCWLDPHDPEHPIPNDDDVIWMCNQCGYEKVASCMWEPRCEQCGNQGSFTWLDLPEG